MHRIHGRRGRALFALAPVIAAYAAGFGFAALVVGTGVYRVASVVCAAAPLPLATSARPVTAAASMVREASMLPTEGRWSRQYARADDDDEDRSPYGGQFGSSSRGGYRSQSFFDRLFGDDDELAR